MSLHATLSPSSAERWISCPASVRMVESAAPEKESLYAQEGTAAHALAELMARDQILGEVTGVAFKRSLARWRKEFGITEEVLGEMVEHGQSYVDLLKYRMSLHDSVQLLLEQRLPTGVPNSWGTSDAVLVSPTSVEIVDFKYGMGVRVWAAGNPQLRLYGVGALENLGDLLGEVDTVRMTVFQPRLDHVDTEELSADELREWRDSLLPIAELAMGPDAPFGPSETACRWCPSSGNCRAQLEWATQRDFGVQPDTLEPAQVAEALDMLPGIKVWIAGLEAYALDAVYSKGVAIPGYKVVMSGGKRSIADPEGAIKALVDKGYELSKVATLKPKGIGDLEKLLKKQLFEEVVGPFVVKGDGSPSLVVEDDKREAINPEASAKEDFA